MIARSLVGQPVVSVIIAIVVCLVVVVVAIGIAWGIVMSLTRRFVGAEKAAAIGLILSVFVVGPIAAYLTGRLALEGHRVLTAAYNLSNVPTFEGTCSSLSQAGKGSRSGPSSTPSGDKRLANPLTGVVPWSTDQKEVDQEIYEQLPKVLRATSPHDARTLACISWSEIEVGTYTGGGKAIQDMADVIIVDLAEGTPRGQATLSGPMPKKVIRSTDSRHGGRPRREIVQYIRDFRW
jgi:hypothetical protein